MRKREGERKKSEGEIKKKEKNKIRKKERERKEYDSNASILFMCLSNCNRVKHCV